MLYITCYYKKSIVLPFESNPIPSRVRSMAFQGGLHYLRAEAQPLLLRFLRGIPKSIVGQYGDRALAFIEKSHYRV